MKPTISDLRERPEFFDTVADRIWSTWWEWRDFPLSYIRGRLEENMNARAIPFALVAHDDTTFLGTASVIASDVEELPQYTPWVAAVWVEPKYRKHRIGRALVARAVDGVLRSASTAPIFARRKSVATSICGKVGCRLWKM